MTSPVIALRSAIVTRLLADAPLLALLGGPHVHDIAPRDAAAPWIAFGETRMRDWSSVGGRGVDVTIQIDAMSAETGSRQALAAAERVVELLDDADLTLSGWRLVRLAFASLEAKRENAGRYSRASLRLRALIETL